ncbi:MAG: GNAT family N-acetyltransferase [Oscillospiraceae bacterium]
MRLETERLIIREFTPADAEGLVRFASDKAITRWLPDWEDSPKWIGWWFGKLEENYRKNAPLEDFLAYAIVEKASGIIVGHLGCGDFDKFGEKELGVCYVTDPARMGKGYATEAMAAFADHLLQTYGQEYLIATIQPDNLSSIRVAEKTGFRFVRSFEMVDNGQTEALPFHYYRKYP